MTNKEIFLDTAVRIGDRLVENAIWEGDLCTWITIEPDQENRKSRKTKKVKAGGKVYQGTAGITIFLTELYKFSSSKRLLKTIKGAIKYTLNTAIELPNNSFGFHSGRVGIAFAAVKVANVLDDVFYLTEAIKILEPLKGNEALDHSIDVIGGAAGAIPALLQMENIFKDKFCLNMAIALGENLISKAYMEPTGWSWSSDNKSSYRNLLGHAHGTAGIGHAFLELYNTTDSNYFLYAAEQAFLYERQFYDKKSYNWPDFRYSELSEYIYNDELEKLKKTILDNAFSSYNKKLMNAWCHGAPGIGLSRIRTYKILNDNIYFEETENAIRGTINYLEERIGANYSLCHGIGGNCDLLIEVANNLDNNSYYKIAEEYGLKGIKDYENLNKKWPCGTMGFVSDPSLMLGEAGIGYFYLRLFSKKVPSVLLITNNGNKVSDIRESKMLQSKYVNNYFEKTISVASKLFLFDFLEFQKLDFKIGDGISDITKTYYSINDFINSLTNSQDKIILEDAFKVEKRKYELTIGLSCYYQEFTNELVKENIENINWQNSIIKLAPDVEIIETSWNWDEFLNKDVIENNYFKSKNEKYFLLHRTKNKIISRSISPFIFSLINLIRSENKLGKITQNVAKLLDDENPSNYNKLEETIVKQLIELFKANLVTIEKDISYEDFIINTAIDNLSSNTEQISNYEKAQIGIYQILRTSKKHLSNEDSLYRLYQIDSYMNNLIIYLEELNMLHYYTNMIELYKAANENREQVFLEFLVLISKTFKNPLDSYIINQ
ncbi:MAG: hypothetical protein COW71_05865 [Ignavibacteriales bacterium CG18_big_fil_WC_8_21_14_2_50_31_20]|nr:MAG: hypothetical protein COW71_05865 [Ignavibacteriales bacterium CG18_big_fil_WC_8_21_14_2_50_31_20]